MTNSFGSVTVGQTSAAASFTISNTGGSPTGTITPILTGTGAGEFVVTNGCTELQAMGTCTVTVAFKPTSSGGKTANLVVSASPGGSVMANLDGSGVAVGNLTVMPGSQAFGQQTVGVAVTNNDKTFTITNGGGTATGALTVTAAGSDPGEFTKQMDTCSGQPLAAAATCTLVIRFAPLSSGSKSAQFVVTGTPGGSITASVAGVAVTPAAISVTPSVNDFGGVITGSNATATFTVTNTGGVTTGALANTISGADAAQFTITNSACMGATLTAGNSCNITVRFSPTGAPGARNASLDVTGTPGGTDNSILSGQAIAPGFISASPSAIPFGAQAVGTSSAASNITITNTGGATTGALTVGISGPNAAEFSVVGANACQGATLAATGQPGSTCTFSVRFSPTLAGTGKQATVTVSGTPGGTATTALSGDGIQPAQLVASPPSKDFGSVTSGTMSATQTFTITNNGGQTSAAVNPTLAGADAAQFSLMNTNCTGTLAAGASCMVIVGFNPTSTGAKTASLNFSGGSAALSGTGISPAQIIANPTSLTFAGNTLIGTSSNVQSFTVTNNGATTTGTLGVTITGANAGDYTQTNNCTTLAQGAQCQVNVTFTPTAAGNRVATVTVTGTPGGSVGVALAGTGQPKLEITVPNINPFDFGTVDIQLFSPCQVVTVRNNTNAQVTLGMAVPANVLVTNTGSLNQPGNPEDFDLNRGACGNPPGTDCVPGLNLQAGATCSLFIDASPDMPGPVAAFVRFAIGGATTGPDTTTLNVTATGDTNSLVITPCTGGNCTSSASPSFNFGNVNTGTTATQVFTLLNQTGATTGILETQISSNAQYHVIQDNCAGTTLADNAMCTVTVIFQPTGGVANATLRIHDVMSATSQAFRDLTGTGVVPAKIVGLPTSGAPFDFGTVFVGEQSTPAAGHTFTISNSGGENTGPIMINLTGTGYSQITGAPGDCISGTTILRGSLQPLPPQPSPIVMTCNIRVRYSPTTVHAGTAVERGSLTVTATPGGTAGTTNNLVGTSQSTISITPLGAVPVDYGNVVIGQVADYVFELSNDSNQAVTFVSGMASNPEFTVVSTMANPLTNCAMLAAGATCNFTLRFAPTGSPGRRGPVSLTINATNGIATFGGSAGTGIFGTAQPVANLVLTPTAADFGSVLSGTGTSTRTFTLSNSGFQTATGIAVSIPNANGNYSQVNTCGATLAGGSSCQITVTFAPPLGNNGTLTATLTVASTLGGAPTAALTGNGIANGAVTVSPATFDFGVAGVGQSSARQLFTVVNTGATMANLTVSVGPNFTRDDAGIATPCGSTLNAAATCQVGIRFSPTTEGLKQAQLTVSPGTYAALAGIGLTNANLTGLSDFNYGTQRIASTTPRSYTIRNNNVGPTGPLTVSLSGGDANDFSISADTCSGNSLAPGGTCTFTANFVPGILTGNGAQTTTLNVTSNAVGATGVPANGGLAISATLMGTGANAPDITITPTTPQADGNRPVGVTDPSPSVFTITNAGGSASTGPIFFSLNQNVDFALVSTGLTNACVNGSTVLAAGQSCQVGVAFNPSTTGPNSTTLTVAETDPAPGGALDTVTGTVSGTGTQQLTGPTNPTTLTANMNTTLTFTNNANVATNPVVVDTTALGTQVSVITDNCVSKVLTAAGTAGSTCTIVVRYIPNGLNGPTDANLNVSSTVNLTSPPFGTGAPSTTAPSVACAPGGCTFNP